MCGCGWGEERGRRNERRKTRATKLWVTVVSKGGSVRAGEVTEGGWRWGPSDLARELGLHSRLCVGLLFSRVTVCDFPLPGH